MSDLQNTVNSLNDKLATLMEIAALVNSNHDLDTIVDRTVQSACRLTDAETGSLMLLDPSSGELRFEVALGKQGEDIKKISVPKGQGIAGWVAENNMATIIPAVQTDDRFYREADKTTQFVTHSMIAVPLHVKGSVIGVMQAINKLDGAFDHADLKLAVALANLVAPAIEEKRSR
jgi:GAF domain-containing protein